MTNVNLDTVLQRSKELRALTKYPDAIELLTEALKSNTDARLYFSRGITFDLMDLPEQAVIDLSKAIKLDPNNVKYYYNRACIFSHLLRRDKDAISDFEELLKLDPDNVKAHQECCLSLLVVGSLSQAWEHAEAALRLAPDNALTQFCAGEAQLSLNRFSDATESLTRAVDLAPEDAHSWAALGGAHESIGSPEDLELAAQAYSQAIRLTRDSAVYFYSRARILMKLGRTDAAIDDLRHALTLNPDEATMMLIDLCLARLPK